MKVMVNIEYITAKKGNGKIACYHATKEFDIINFIKINKDNIDKQLLKFGGVLLALLNFRWVKVRV